MIRLRLYPPELTSTGAYDQIHILLLPFEYVLFQPLIIGPDLAQPVHHPFDDRLGALQGIYQLAFSIGQFALTFSSRNRLSASGAHVGPGSLPPTYFSRFSHSL